MADGRPQCCGRGMTVRGYRGKARLVEWHCPVCGRYSRNPDAGFSRFRMRLVKVGGSWQISWTDEGYAVSRGDRGRWRVQLPGRVAEWKDGCLVCCGEEMTRLRRGGSRRRGVWQCEACRWRSNGVRVVHWAADMTGGQYLYRFIVADALGRRLRPDEHVHHMDEDLSNNLELANLELLYASYHGSLHAYRGLLAGPSELSKGLELETPLDPQRVPRWRWLIGSAAEEKNQERA